MLTASRDDDPFAALRAGACGYLLKDMDSDRLAAALRGLMGGEAALPRSLALKVMRQLRTSGRRRLLPCKGSLVAKLTDRESEVLELLVEGLSTEQIGERLFVGKVTVRTHVSNVLTKLRVPDRAGAVRVLNARGNQPAGRRGVETSPRRLTAEVMCEGCPSSTVDLNRP